MSDKIAAKNIKNFTVVKCDVFKESIDHQANVVFTSMTLHHMGDTPSAIEALSRLVAPSGYICIADLVSEDGSFHSSDFTGPHGFSEDDIRNAFTAANIEHISYQMIYSIQKGDRSYPVFLAVGKKPHHARFKEQG